ncbi:archaeosortase/exosortase family protein, partial [Enterococcus faecium]|uniref:archaeosortase/exosortase family protein n=3 Tax=Bacteria TaxID=2 RepID=UPI003F51B271
SFARQFGLVVMLQGAVVTLLGAQVARGLLLPLCYAFFLVPFGEELEPPLQQLTVGIVMPLLHLVGVPAVSNGVLIHAGRYWFEVAEACS